MPSGCLTRLMPTSMTTAPSRTWSAGDQAGLADGDDQDVRPPRVGRQVARGDVAERDGGHLLGQQQRDGLAGDLAGADDDRLGARAESTPVELISSITARAVQGAISVWP